MTTGRFPKSEIRKRRLPDRDQIEYFRMGYTSIQTPQEFQEQFLEFWHNLPESYRENEDSDPFSLQRRKDALNEMHDTFNEDEFKHDIHALTGDLSTIDLINPTPHCVIRQKIQFCVDYYDKMNQDKIKDEENGYFDDEEYDDIEYKISDSPHTKRRKLSQQNNKNNDVMIIDSDIEYDINEDLDINDIQQPFGIKLESLQTEHNNQSISSLSPRRSKRRMNAKKEEMKKQRSENTNTNNAQIPIPNKNDQTPLLRRKRGRPPSKKKKAQLNEVYGIDDAAESIALIQKQKVCGSKRKRAQNQNNNMPSLEIKRKNVRNRRINDRPHVLFAANVQMPFYDQLIIPFDKFQQHRKKFKVAHSKKEVNSVTKLCRNHRLKQIESQKGYKMMRDNECILRVAIMHSNKSSEKFLKSHEYLILSTQKLSVLKDTFYCLMNENKVGRSMKNCYFFIEGVFYDDCRHEHDENGNFCRLSESVMDWMRCEEHWKQSGVYQQKNMEDVAIKDLNIRLGSHYLYCHQGDCQHVIVFTEMRVSNQWDVQNEYAYPIVTYRQILKRQKCGVCEMYPAKYVTYGDKLTTHNPFFFCERCYYPFHYDEEGELLYDDFQVFDYIHD